MLPYIADYALSNKSVCRGCGAKIIKSTLRVGIMMQCRHFDGMIPNWFHFHCFFVEHMPDRSKEIENFTCLRWEDQREIENIIAQGESPFAAEDKKLDMKRAISMANSKAILCDYVIANAKNGQTKCEFCETHIKKLEIRIMKKQTPKLWYHLKCFEKIHTQIDFLESGTKIEGFDTLSDEDRQIVEETLPGVPEKDDESPLKKIKLTIDKPEKSMPPEDYITKQNLDIMYKYRGELKENLNKAELVTLLEHNRQLVPYKMDAILDRASDMLTFGALERCRRCAKGQLVFTNTGYKCTRGHGHSWSKCKVVLNPNRMFTDIPLELKLRHTFLYNYEYVERTRIAPRTRKENKRVSNGPLKTKNLVVLGFHGEEKNNIITLIRSLSGRVVPEVRRSVLAVITTEEEVAKNTDDIQLSKDLDVYVVNKKFLSELFEDDDIWSLDEHARKHSLVDWGVELHNRVPGKYRYGAREEASTISETRRVEEEKDGKRRMVIKGGIAIEPDSGLEKIAHVYQSGNCKYNVVLSRTNYTTNQNTYYKIQLLESDDDVNTKDYWVFRAWGRIGTAVGSFNVKKMDSLEAAIVEFSNVFKKMTRNKWESRHSMVSVPGAYTMIEVNYDVRQEEITDLCEHIADSSLKPAVAELMAIIFNVQAMEKMMLEYQLDLNKMPLGKLSRSQIKSAYDILTQATWALQKNQKSKSEVIRITNLFYSHMPHNTALARPPLLDNIELLKKKSEMLADLMELETAYAMIQRGAEGEGGNILDGYYKQLNADIEVVAESSDEFNLIQQYVTNTHADTHRNYDLKILEIFKVKRNGEEEKYSQYKQLNNRRLLWHGSRTTNYAGILSQGLRIAPSEAPQTGYMFGKGIYFADMVSKSANYCCTSRENTVGLMLLCEVALGNMLDKFNAESITTLPSGVNSVRGVGATEPEPQQMKTLDGGVQVPLGKPVTDIDCNSALLYNEYIVYDVSQVNIKYLLKMDFKFKNKRR